MWLLIVLVSLLLLVILLLSIPVGFAFSLNIYGRPRLKLSLVWLFGLVNRPMKSKPRKKRTEEKKKRKKKRRGLTVWDVIRSPGLVRQVLKLIKSIVGCVHLRHFKLDLKFGLGSPADTGFIFGIIQPLIIFLPPNCSVNIRPEFPDLMLEGYSTGVATFRPICIIGALLGFVFSLASMRLFWGFVIDKWKKKK